MKDQIWVNSANAHFATDEKGRFVSPEIFERLKSEGKAYSNDDGSMHWFATTIQPKHKYQSIHK